MAKLISHGEGPAPRALLLNSGPARELPRLLPFCHFSYPPQNCSLEAAGSVLPLRILVGRKPHANGPSGAGLIQSYLEVDEQEPRKVL